VIRNDRSAIPPRNDIDVFAQDLGLVAIVEHGSLRGYDVCAGGGMGMTHGDAGTYPRLAETIGFVHPERVQAIAEAAIGIQRDSGDRADRKHARLKYTIDDRGIAWFKQELERRAGFALQPARDFQFDQRGAIPPPWRLCASDIRRSPIRRGGGAPRK